MTDLSNKSLDQLIRALELVNYELGHADAKGNTRTNSKVVFRAEINLEIQRRIYGRP